MTLSAKQATALPDVEEGGITIGLEGTMVTLYCSTEDQAKTWFDLLRKLMKHASAQQGKA